jgi:starch synthase (maltosyl-transferring)
MGALGREPYDGFRVRDQITGEEYQWGQSNYVRLEPARAVAHILALPPIDWEQRAPLLRRE